MASKRVISASVVLGRVYKDADAVAGLCAYYGVPENTILRAVESLVSQGYLTRLPPGGHGAQYRLTPRGSLLLKGQSDQETEAKANTYSHTGVAAAAADHIVRMTGDGSDES